MEKVVQALGAKKIIMIRNHGVLIAAGSVAEAVFSMRTLEVACQSQISAMRTGGDILLPDSEEAARIVSAFTGNPDNEFDGPRQWPAFRRDLDRENPSYESRPFGSPR